MGIRFNEQRVKQGEQVLPVGISLGLVIFDLIDSHCRGCIKNRWIWNSHQSVRLLMLKPAASALRSMGSDQTRHVCQKHPLHALFLPEVHLSKSSPRHSNLVLYCKSSFHLFHQVHSHSRCIAQTSHTGPAKSFHMRKCDWYQKFWTSDVHKAVRLAVRRCQKIAEIFHAGARCGACAGIEIASHKSENIVCKHSCNFLL